MHSSTSPPTTNTISERYQAQYDDLERFLTQFGTGVGPFDRGIDAFEHGPIARHWLEDGHEVYAFDLDDGKVDAVAAAGAVSADSAGDFAAQCDVILIIVGTGDQVEAALFGADRVVDGTGPGDTVVISSTITRSDASKGQSDFPGAWNSWTRRSRADGQSNSGIRQCSPADPTTRSNTSSRTYGCSLGISSTSAEWGRSNG